MVRTGQTGPAVAAATRCLRNVDQRNHAATNARCHRDSVLAALDGCVPDRERARRRATRRCAASLGWAWLLFACAQLASRRASCGAATRGTAATHGRGVTHHRGHWPVHGRGRGEYCVRRTHATCRRQRRTCPCTGRRCANRYQGACDATRPVATRHCACRGAPAAISGRRFQSSVDGVRSAGLHAEVATMSALSAASASSLLGQYARCHRAPACCPCPQENGRIARVEALGPLADECAWGRAACAAPTFGFVGRPMGAADRRIARRGTRVVWRTVGSAWSGLASPPGAEPPPLIG